MSDPFWDDRTRPPRPAGEPGWAHQRGKVRRFCERHAGIASTTGPIAAGAPAAGLFLVLTAGADAGSAADGVHASDDIDFLEMTPLLEHLDELQDAVELTTHELSRYPDVTAVLAGIYARREVCEPPRRCCRTSTCSTTCPHRGRREP